MMMSLTAGGHGGEPLRLSSYFSSLYLLLCHDVLDWEVNKVFHI